MNNKMNELLHVKPEQSKIKIVIKSKPELPSHIAQMQGYIRSLLAINEITQDEAKDLQSFIKRDYAFGTLPAMLKTFMLNLNQPVISFKANDNDELV